MLQRLKIICKPDTILVFFLIALGVGVKIISLSLPFFDDDGSFGFIFRSDKSFFLRFSIWPHPPLGSWIYAISQWLLGSNMVGIRIVPVLFSLILIFILYRFISRVYNQKLAIWSAILMFFTYFPFFSSVVIDFDNTILTLVLFLLFIRSYNRMILKEKASLVVDGILLGLATLAKMQAPLFLLPIAIFNLYESRSFKKTFKSLAVISIVAAFVFLLFPLVIWLAYPKTFLSHMRESIGYVFSRSSPANIFTRIKSLKHLMISLTPLYLGAIWFVLWKFRKTQKHILIWFFSIITVYVIFAPLNLAPAFPKYFSIMTPYLAIFAALTISYFELQAKDIIFTSVLSSLTAIFLLFFNEHFLGMTKISILTPGALSPYQLVLTLIQKSMFVIGIILFLMVAFFARKDSLPIKKKITFVLFLGIMVGYNLFLVINPILQKENLLFSSQIMVEYFQQNKLKGPIYSWNEDMPFYLGLKGYGDYTDLDGLSADELRDRLTKKGGTLFIYAPNPLHRKDLQEVIKKYCILKKQIERKGIIFGEIYEAAIANN